MCCFFLRPGSVLLMSLIGGVTHSSNKNSKAVATKFFACLTDVDVHLFLRTITRYTFFLLIFLSKVLENKESCADFVSFDHILQHQKSYRGSRYNKHDTISYGARDLTSTVLLQNIAAYLRNHPSL